MYVTDAMLDDRERDATAADAEAAAAAACAAGMSPRAEVLK
jgi:hypothetical protein